MRCVSLALAAAALLAAALPAAAQPEVEALAGSGVPATRKLDLAPFTKIDAGGTFDVSVSVGLEQQVEVTIDDNLWDNLVAEVDDGRLALDWDKHCNPSVHCTVSITVKSLDEFTMHGAGNAGLEGLGGAALRFYLRGAGNAAMAGKVDDLQLVLTGTGDVFARDLQARKVSIVLSGVGNCEVFAADSLEADVTGVGDITYWGKPGHVDTKVTGMGNVEAQ